jgi:hypothetical protein
MERQKHISAAAEGVMRKFMFAKYTSKDATVHAALAFDKSFNHLLNEFDDLRGAARATFLESLGLKSRGRVADLRAKLITSAFEANVHKVEQAIVDAVAQHDGPRQGIVRPDRMPGWFIAEFTAKNGEHVHKSFASTSSASDWLLEMQLADQSGALSRTQQALRKEVASKVAAVKAMQVLTRSQTADLKQVGL